MNLLIRKRAVVRESTLGPGCNLSKERMILPMDIQEVIAGRRAMREYTQPFRSHKALGAKNGNAGATAVFVCPW